MLFECGLFMGALGRRRTFLFAPKGTHIELPTDLRGLAIAKYSWSELQSRDSLRPTIREIILAIKAEWRRIQHAARKFAEKEFLGMQHHALVSLFSASNHILDVITDVPSRMITGLHDRNAFDQSKRETVAEVRRLSDIWLPDAQLLNLQKIFLILISEVIEAVESVPFYRDLKIADNPAVLFRDLPWLKRIFMRFPSLSPEALDFAMRLDIRNERVLSVLRGALTQEERAIEHQVEHVLRLLSEALENWWKDHKPRLIKDINVFQRQLVDMLQGMTYTYLKA